MTYQLIFASVVAMALAAGWLEHAVRAPLIQPAFAAVQQNASRAPGPGFAAAFGRSAAVRNLVF